MAKVYKNNADRYVLRIVDLELQKESSISIPTLETLFEKRPGGPSHLRHFIEMFKEETSKLNG